MPENKFAARLRHIADVVERLGAESSTTVSDCQPIYLLWEDFRRAFAGQEATSENDKDGIWWTIEAEGVRFRGHQRKTFPPTATTKAIVPAAEVTP